MNEPVVSSILLPLGRLVSISRFAASQMGERADLPSSHHIRSF